MNDYHQMPFKFQVLESFVRPTFTKDPKSTSSTSHTKFCQCHQRHFHKLNGNLFNFDMLSPQLPLSYLEAGRVAKTCRPCRPVGAFFLAGANFWEKHAKNRRKQAKTRENRRKTGAFLVLIFLGEKLVGANFYAFCNYGQWRPQIALIENNTN